MDYLLFMQRVQYGGDESQKCTVFDIKISDEELPFHPRERGVVFSRVPNFCLLQTQPLVLCYYKIHASNILLLGNDEI